MTDSATSPEHATHLPEAIAASCVRFLIDRFGPATSVYLYGSFAAGRARPGSDVDLAVLRTAPIDARALIDAALELPGVIDRDVDLVDLRAVSTVLAAHVVAEGRLLHEGDRSNRQHFELLALRLYMELNELRRPILEAIARSGRIYGR